MSDHGIIFSAPMVRALLNTGKSQTRRILRRPTDHFHADYTVPEIRDGRIVCSNGESGLARPVRTAPSAGDRLYVREGWRQAYAADWRREDLGRPPKPSELDPATTAIEYLADGTRELGGRSWPSIFMPRWASRLTLIVKEGRLERLKVISRPDAIAEGLTAYQQPLGDPAWGMEGLPVEMQRIDPRQAYAQLWNSLHDKDGDRWRDDPWVTVTTFRVERHNIDRRLA